MRPQLKFKVQLRHDGGIGLHGVLRGNTEAEARAKLKLLPHWKVTKFVEVPWTECCFYDKEFEAHVLTGHTARTPTPAPTPPPQEEAWKPRVEEVCYVITVPNYWGKGLTLAEAAANALEAGGKRTDKCVAYCYVHPDAKLLKEEVWVNDLGDISYPLTALSIKLFGLREGQRVTLGSLISKPVRDKEGA